MEQSMTTLSRRAILAGIACLPALSLCRFPQAAADPMAPKCIRWPLWAGHDRAGCVMTPAELAKRYVIWNAEKPRPARRGFSFGTAITTSGYDFWRRPSDGPQSV
jgi:hypothetical protein